MGNLLCTGNREYGTCTDPTFRGLKIPPSRSCAFLATLKRMDELRLPHTTSVGILSGLNTQRTWDIYIFFSNWPSPVTSACVQRMMEQFQTSLDEWLSKLSGYNGFTKQRVKVRIFGFVFRRGVSTDSSFERRYGSYPIVREWLDTSEVSPWIVSANRPTTNMYDSKLDLHTIRVVGNRTQTGATFLPKQWDSYKHPEGCMGYQTRFWHGADMWNATAQRHYLRVSGVLADTTSGDFGPYRKVLTHEMGHCFFLDDLYDIKKYPTPLPSAICSYDCQIRVNDSVMHGGPVVTPFDHAQLRHVWDACRSRQAPASR